MRFEVKELTVGETRIVRRFLFLPMRIGNEIRWLETVSMRQQAIGVSMMGEPPHSPKWINVAFVELEAVH